MGPAPRPARLAAFLSALAGLGVSTYLTWVHYTEPTALSCPDTGVVNCAKVTTSSQSEIFGVVPVAVTGLVFFVVMAALTSPPGWRSTATWLRATRLGGAVAGVGMVLYLVFVEAWQLRAICLWCTAVHLLTFALFVAVVAGELLRAEDDGSEPPAALREDGERQLGPTVS